MAVKTLPNLIIGGVRKSATTSLFYYLSQHPDVGACRIKEPSYFKALKYGKELGPLEDYASLFAHCADKPYRMEASPSYFSGGSLIAESLERTLPHPYMLVSLRDPVETCWSNYNFLRSRAVLDKHESFEEYIDKCERYRAAGLDEEYKYRDYNAIRVGNYYDFLPAWTERFGDRMKVVLFDDIKEKPMEVVTSICQWLDLEVYPAEHFEFSIENKTFQYRNRSIQLAALWLNRRYKSFFKRHRGIKNSLRRVYYLINRDEQDNPTMSAAQRSHLESIFFESNRQIAHYLREQGQSQLPGWLNLPSFSDKAAKASPVRPFTVTTG